MQISLFSALETPRVTFLLQLNHFGAHEFSAFIPPKHILSFFFIPQFFLFPILSHSSFRIKDYYHNYIKITTSNNLNKKTSNESQKLPPFMSSPNKHFTYRYSQYRNTPHVAVHTNHPSRCTMHGRSLANSNPYFLTSL